MSKNPSVTTTTIATSNDNNTIISKEKQLKTDEKSEVKTTTTTVTRWWHANQCYVGGWTFALLYLILIATTFIDPLSAPATGTIAVHSWLIGWLVVYWNRNNGLNDRYIRIEAGILLCALFQLAVGSFAFSRLYNGPFFFNHDQDVFQTLSSIYLKEVGHLIPLLPESVVQWWIESSQQRFVGIGWIICDVADVMVHQVPFILLCYIISRHVNGWDTIIHEIRSNTWVTWASLLSGPIHRILWDYSNCGYAFCDGPYRGFLDEVTRIEQFLWHLLPCTFITMYLTMIRR